MLPKKLVKRRARLKAMLSVGAILIPGGAAAQKTMLYVAARVPIVGHSIDIGAVRQAPPTLPKHAVPVRATNTWTKLATLPNATVHDVAFESATVGYAAAELGQVWKTEDGGNTWQLILNRGFPYYYYGIAVSGQKVIASGFDDSNSEAILTESKDAGTTWSQDVVLSKIGRAH